MLQKLKTPDRNSTRGFTIVELLIATAVFSVILLICTIGMIHMGQIYYKGITDSRVQEATRDITEDISQSIQFNAGQVVANAAPAGPGNMVKGICVGNRRYSYIVNKQLTDSNTPQPDQQKHVLVADTVDVCPGAQDITTSLGAGSQELLGTGMRIAQLCVSTPGQACNVISGTGNLYKIDVTIIYGDSDLLDDPANPTRCATSIRGGGQFCATSSLSTIVQKRIQ